MEEKSGAESRSLVAVGEDVRKISRLAMLMGSHTTASVRCAGNRQ